MEIVIEIIMKMWIAFGPNIQCHVTTRFVIHLAIPDSVQQLLSNIHANIFAEPLWVYLACFCVGIDEMGMLVIHGALRSPQSLSNSR